MGVDGMASWNPVRAGSIDFRPLNRTSAVCAMKTLGRVIVIMILVAATAELSAFVYFAGIKGGKDWVPAYLRSDTTESWRTETDPWGAWHLPNATARHIGRCFDVAVRSNSHGARDRERTVDGKGRVLVLGDSFVEGWGVDEEHRFSNVMETLLEREVLNFGSDYFLGPLQYEILYRELASRFEHDLLVIGFAPHNDFTDNDLSIWGGWRGRNRYRPYYEPDTETPVYLVDKPAAGLSLADLRWMNSSATETLTNLARQYTWSAGFAKEAAALVRKQAKVRNVNPSDGYSGYRDFEDAQLENVLRSLDALIGMAKMKGRSVLLAILPARNDLTVPGSENKLRPIVMEFARDREVAVIDILQTGGLTNEDFQTCDWFWSARGHGKVGQAIAAEARKILAID